MGFNSSVTSFLQLIKKGTNYLNFQFLETVNNGKQELVAMECKRWGSKGINIKYEVRDNRNGYKAGALKERMKHSYVNECDYVAIFYADFNLNLIFYGALSVYPLFDAKFSTCPCSSSLEIR